METRKMILKQMKGQDGISWIFHLFFLMINPCLSKRSHLV